MMMQASSEEIPEESSTEKPANPTVNIQEEYIHEQHGLSAFAFNGKGIKYDLLDEADLAFVCVDLLSPPPDL